MRENLTSRINRLKKNKRLSNKKVVAIILIKKAEDAVRKKRKEENRLMKEKRRRLKAAYTSSRNDVNIESILPLIERIADEHDNNISMGDLGRAVSKELKCGEGLINNRCGSMGNILRQLGIVLVRKIERKWQKKEDLGIELCKELCGEGDVKKYYKGIGYPDFVPLDETQPIIDIKSTLNDIRMDQFERYEKLRPGVKFMVYEKAGKSDISETRILYMEKIINNFPDNKRLVFLEQWKKIS